MQKRGQIVFFVIIGLLLIIALLFALYSKKPEEKAPVVFPEKEQLRTLLSNCLEKGLGEALDIAGLQGGYIYPSAFPAPLNIAIAILPYWYYDGQIVSPTRVTVESQLAAYIEERAKRCTKGIQWGLGEPRATVTLLDTNAHTVLIYPMTLKKSGAMMTFEDPILTKHPSSLKNLLESARLLVQKTAQKPDVLDLTVINQIGARFPVTIYPYETEHVGEHVVPEKADKNIVVVELRDKGGGKPSSLTFAMRY